MALEMGNQKKAFRVEHLCFTDWSQAPSQICKAGGRHQIVRKMNLWMGARP